MKRLWIFILIFCGVLSTDAQTNEKYIKKMQETLQIIDTAKTFAGITAGANQFERIAGAEKEQWMPAYYAAFSYVILSYMEKENAKKDEYLDKADAMVEKASEIKSEESEIYTLKAMINSARIAIDPMNRSQKYGMLSTQQLQKAMQLDPDNPRAYYLMGMNLYYTPPAFGGGVDKAKGMLETALEKYNVENEDPLWPKWGKDQTEKMLSSINKDPQK